MTETARKRRGLGRSTVFDVAKLAETSAITISRYFKQPERVSQEVRERIRKAIDELGYIRNEAAGGLASTQGRIVGAIVPSVSNSIFAETIQGLSTTLSQHNYQLLLATHDYSSETEEKIVKAFLGWLPRALVLTGATHSPATEALLAGLKIPVIETWDIQADRPYPQIGFSHIATGREMTQYLYAQGYRRIVYVASSISSDFRARQRAQGYEESMRELGLAPQIVQSLQGAPLDAGEQAFSEQMARAERPDALFFANDNMAAGAIYQAARMGIRVPEDCAIAGFGDFPASEKITPGLTTIRVPRYEIGRLAALAILQRLGELPADQATAQPAPLAYELIVRASA
ncbi:LacI family DNA-binding transcriptional regulator [Janthinobacterium aquaticum]|uniref:LacI family DNA-binding transcriptional regulator n=1 Tax=Janthinobacterium sp. FT58W TaxID=2654254 RepID=UPI001264C73E|nr:LacI family DNA-binding transcriptional regulator [Janthinobacterium sp. FT58W]KAB8039275.1 LacI family DNA-binding transcriptional regulator [Janthinobacterium sp. FT58W]